MSSCLFTSEQDGDELLGLFVIDVDCEKETDFRIFFTGNKPNKYSKWINAREAYAHCTWCIWFIMQVECRSDHWSSKDHLHIQIVYEVIQNGCFGSYSQAQECA